MSGCSRASSKVTTRATSRSSYLFALIPFLLRLVGLSELNFLIPQFVRRKFFFCSFLSSPFDQSQGLDQRQKSINSIINLVGVMRTMLFHFSISQETCRLCITSCRNAFNHSIVYPISLSDNDIGDKFFVAFLIAQELQVYMQSM